MFLHALTHWKFEWERNRRFYLKALCTFPSLRDVTHVRKICSQKLDNKSLYWGRKKIQLSEITRSFWVLRCAPSSLIIHSSEIRGLCWMKCLSEILQNLPYFIYMKTQSCFFHFILLYFFPNECPGQDQGRHSLGKK